MLDQRPVVQPHQRGSLTKPRLQRRVAREVADEDGVPLIGWIGAQRLEEALEIAVDVADDQDWQAFRSHSSPRPSTRRTDLVYEPIVCSSLRAERQCQVRPNTASASCRVN